VSEQPAEPLVHLEVSPQGAILVGLPDQVTKTVVTLELTPKCARELGEQLWKAGTVVEATHPTGPSGPAS
jgi:hypothetical protein